jgi:hypothetical protein
MTRSAPLARALRGGRRSDAGVIDHNNSGTATATAHSRAATVTPLPFAVMWVPLGVSPLT